MTVRRSLILLTLVTFVIPLVTLADSMTPRAQPAATSDNLQLHTVGPGMVEVVVSAVGSIEASDVVAVGFTGPGRVESIYVAEGDVVLAGDLLAQQANETQRINYAQAVLAVEAARLRVEDLRDGPDDSQVRVAQANLDSAWGQYNAISGAVRPEDLRAAELRVQQAETALTEAQQTRSTARGGQGEEAYLLLDAQVGQASFNLELARLQLESLRTGNQGGANSAYARVLQAQAELERVLAGPSELDIERAELGVQQALNTLMDAENALNRTQITAPIDGIVSALTIEVGSLVTPGRAVLELTRVDSLKLTVQVDEVDISRVAEGMAARVRIDALPGLLLPARIEQIALLGRSEGGIVSYDVQLGLDAGDPRVRVGMTSEAALIVEEKRDVLVVPNIYIRLDRRANQAFVNVLRPDGTLEEIEVRLGLQGQENSEIIDGLEMGTVVALDLSGEQFSFGG